MGYNNPYVVGAHTIETWVNPTSANQTGTLFASTNGSLFGFDYTGTWFRVVNGKLWWRLITGKRQSSGSLLPVRSHRQHVIAPQYLDHVVASYDGATAALYVNGQSDGSASASGGLVSAAYDHRIGFYFSSDRWTGGLDEFALYGSGKPAAMALRQFRARSNTSGSLPSDANDGLTVNDPGGDHRAAQIAQSSDPVSTLNGDYQYRHGDTATAGRGPTPVVSRVYNSNDPRSGSLGPGWRHNYTIQLHAVAGSGDVYLITSEGRSDRYTTTGSGSFNSTDGVTTRLVGNSDGTYTATLSNQTTWHFNSNGQLTSIVDRY